MDGCYISLESNKLSDAFEKSCFCIAVTLESNPSKLVCFR